MTEFLNNFEKIYFMLFEIKNQKLLEKYASIWNSVSKIKEEKFYKQPVLDEKYLITN